MEDFTVRVDTGSAPYAERFLGNNLEENVKHLVRFGKDLQSICRFSGLEVPKAIELNWFSIFESTRTTILECK